MVFTCPECVAAAQRFHAGERVDQIEVFEYLDGEVSVSALSRAGGQDAVLDEESRSSVEDDLPF